MKLAIDSYCYHRAFGECYPGLQQPAERRLTVWDFLRRARRLGVAGVSLEACFLPSESDFLAHLRDTLDEYGLERVWAWGHPNGLCSGTDRQAAQDLVAHLGHARALGAGVMRIVGGSRRTRPASFALHRRQLGGLLRKLLPAAEDHGVVLALENHIDLLADELADLVGSLDSPWLGVCLDTGNNLRLHEDPVAVAAKLAPLARATHIKDIGVRRGDPNDFAFWPSVPLGKGLVDLRSVLASLRQARYQGLLAIEIDYLHPDFPDEHRAVAASVRYLNELLAEAPAPTGTLRHRIQETPMVNVSLPLFGTPGQELGEGTTVSARQLRDLSAELQGRLERASLVLERLVPAGWAARVAVHDILLSHPAVHTEADACRRLQELELDPEQFVIMDEPTEDDLA